MCVFKVVFFIVGLLLLKWDRLVFVFYNGIEKEIYNK